MECPHNSTQKSSNMATESYVYYNRQLLCGQKELSPFLLEPIKKERTLNTFLLGPIKKEPTLNTLFAGPNKKGAYTKHPFC